MEFPASLLSALGFTEPKPEQPVVFMRAGCTKDSRVRRVKPEGSNAHLIRTYLENPKDASPAARRTFRQAIVLRAVGGKLRHYPLWLLFSNTYAREVSANKHNQLPPDIHWVRRKRKQVCRYLKARAKVTLLEQIDSCTKPKTVGIPPR